VLGADKGPDIESSNGEEVWMEMGWNEDELRDRFPPLG
jgi:hypothetical protein